MPDLKIFTVGGTIDKIYFDQKSAYQVGDPKIIEVLQEANVTVEFETETIMQKDSLDMDKNDRQIILEKVSRAPHKQIVITHGTDTMIETAKTLSVIQNKTIVLTGSMQPARFKNSDAVFNIGCAIAAVQTLPSGVYITMNGRIFEPFSTRKNVGENRFEKI
ncbi:MAG: asparaginase domain-containing protein [Candidatus Marinimicrobia bacterium]|nr:asparaginase domain-containing protein [Candidatus Neomarinimicrobiota bacterium]